ncbi:MAG: peptide deformylase [Acidobacteriota bacterium]
MSTREILQLGNPTLWKQSARVEEFSSTATRSLINDLNETLAAFRTLHGYGRGIAAPQIGILQRIIFIRMQPTGFSGPLINPEIVWADQQQMELWDDCFSFPDLMVRVLRAVRIRVNYYDEHGSTQVLEAEGDLSELLQHEIDHLDGILAVQRAISPQALATRAEWQRQQR